MTTTTTTSSTHLATSTSSRPSDARRLTLFGLIAVASGWILLGVPAALGLPTEPFILAMLGLGLVLPALVLSARSRARGGRMLLRSVFRLPRPWWLLVPAAIGIPGLVWITGAILGVAEPMDAPRLGALALEMLSGLLIVNLWEEMAWAGFFQRRVSERSGMVVGILVTAALFAAVHLPLALAGASNPADAATGVAILVVAAVGLRSVTGALLFATGPGILVVAVLHASFNAAGGLLTPGHDAIRITVVVAVGVLAAVPFLRRPRAVRRTEAHS